MLGNFCYHEAHSMAVNGGRTAISQSTTNMGTHVSICKDFQLGCPKKRHCKLSLCQQSWNILLVRPSPSGNQYKVYHSLQQVHKHARQYSNPHKLGPENSC